MNNSKKYNFNIQVLTSEVLKVAEIRLTHKNKTFKYFMTLYVYNITLL